MKLRQTDAHVYAFTQRERAAVVIALKSLIEDEAGDAGRPSSYAQVASRILDRMAQEERP